MKFFHGRIPPNVMANLRVKAALREAAEAEAAKPRQARTGPVQLTPARRMAMVRAVFDKMKREGRLPTDASEIVR